MEFGYENSLIPAIVLELPDNKKVELSGKIDRIDVAQTKDGNVIRIIDYKTYSKDLKLSNMYYGIDLQLITYLDSVRKNDNSLPGGILYFSLNQALLKAKRNITDKDLEDAIKKQFKMNGYILADISVIKMMDKNIANTSDTIPAKLNSDGTIAKGSRILTEKQFEALEKRVEKILKELSGEILKGNVDINPCYMKGKTSCEYCEYSSICNFDIKFNGNKYNYIKSLKDEEVLEKLDKNTTLT